MADIEAARNLCAHPKSASKKPHVLVNAASCPRPYCDEQLFRFHETKKNKSLCTNTKCLEAADKPKAIGFSSSNKCRLIRTFNGLEPTYWS